MDNIIKVSEKVAFKIFDSMNLQVLTMEKIYKTGKEIQPDGKEKKILVFDREGWKEYGYCGHNLSELVDLLVKASIKTMQGQESIKTLQDFVKELEKFEKSLNVRDMFDTLFISPDDELIKENKKLKKQIKEMEKTFYENQNN